MAIEGKDPNITSLQAKKPGQHLCFWMCHQNIMEKIWIEETLISRGRNLEKNFVIFFMWNKSSDKCMFHKRSCQCLHCTEIFKNTNIPVDGIKVKFGAKVNSDQIKSNNQSNKINQTWKVGRNQTIKPWKLEDLESWKTEEFWRL